MHAKWQGIAAGIASSDIGRCISRCARQHASRAASSLIRLCPSWQTGRHCTVASLGKTYQDPPCQDLLNQPSRRGNVGVCLPSGSQECREAHQPGSIMPLQAFAFVSHALPVQQGPCRPPASTASKPDVHVPMALCELAVTHIQPCMLGNAPLLQRREPAGQQRRSANANYVLAGAGS